MPQGAMMDEKHNGKNGGEERPLIPEDEKAQNTPAYGANNAEEGGEKRDCAQEQSGGAQEPRDPKNGYGFSGGGAEPAKRKFVLWQKPVEQKNRRRYSRSFQIALSGISCAIAVAALMLGYYVYWILATAYIVAQVALMVPLSKQFYVMDVLAYIATVILALLVGGLVGRWWEFIPFVMFFGLHPLANSLQLKYRVNRWVALAVKMVWFDAMLLVMYYALGSFMGLDSSTFWQTINDYVWIIILVAGSLFLWLYDYVMFKVQIWINMLVYRIKK